MTSKPFLQRMAILALKKMRSYTSDKRKKSYQIALVTLLSRRKAYTHPVYTEPLRAGLPTNSRTEKHWNLSVVVYLANNGFKYAEDAVELVHPVRPA
jgi:hypothetical protein